MVCGERVAEADPDVVHQGLEPNPGAGLRLQQYTHLEYRRINNVYLSNLLLNISKRLKHIFFIVQAT